MKILPSIASAYQFNLERELERIGNRHYENLHIDIEDGNFIPNITFGLKTVRQIRENFNLPFSVHLMVNNPKDYIDELCNMDCSVIFVHAESTMYLSEVLNKIKSYGIKAGIAFNPVSRPENFKYLFDICDSIMIMTSEPDFEGQVFNPLLLENIENIFPHKDRKIELWVDGGVKETHLELLREKKVDYVIMGREIFDRKDPQEFLKRINTK